ncbi:MAG: ATP-binding protein [Thermoprotei archaeon]|nr:MAG: ATP-binding protein [Thermoprotei archaeon]
MNQCAVEVRDLTKKYGSLIAVDHINFCVRDGEIFGFLGPNGAGKTTTVRMLCGLTRITEGRAYIYGHDVVKEHMIVKGLIGVVPDISNLYHELSCWDNLIFMGEMYGLAKSERIRRAEELLKLFGLWSRRNVLFKNLSKGLKRRLTIAAALMHNPMVLFLDEPTIGLDVMGKRVIWRIARELNSRGITIFLTTHNIYEAFRLCGRVAIINHGRIVALDTPARLKRLISAEEVLEIEFYPSNPPVNELKRIKGIVDVRYSGSTVRLVVSDPLKALEGLVRYARMNGYSLNMVSLRSADAEEVFINIVGGYSAG